MNAKEKLFCENLAVSQDAVKAALLSGFTDQPEKTAAKLLEKPAIRRRCKRLIKNSTDTLDAICGLYRIAFSNPTSAVCSLFSEDVTDLKNADLFSVSEIKRGTNGAVEIKFFDKIRALQTLAQLSPTENESKIKGFYEAIMLGAKSVSENRSEEE
ncbi:MAG: terminase small subunit [Clostridia bacterium]|nr:terminase small subunit [Clostridia bacterium]